MNKKWEQRKKIDNEQVENISNKLGLPIISTQLLVARGLNTEDEINEFLDTSLDKLDDPFKLNDMQKAIDRIELALDNNEKMIIYGDYDSDGLTSTSIMKEAIEIIGGEVDTYIPDRFSDGYGPNIEAYQKIIDQGYNLIITVDNGVSGFEAIEYANQHDVDVIVTDHHSLPEQLPNAIAIVHPQITNHEYSFKYLSGAGVAFKVASALLQEIPVDLLDLAAIGTISDVVELSGENRVIVANGLKQIQTGSRTGLKTLFKTAKLDITKTDEDTIGFQVAPRLNALGRVKNANIGVELLTAQDEMVAKEIAKDVEETNLLRRQYSDEVYNDAKNQLSQKNDDFQILYGDEWNEGVLGIVAGRIADETNRPTVVLSRIDEVYKGSGRAPSGFNLFEAMNNHRDLFDSFGGHAQACGVSVKSSCIEEFVSAMQVEIQKQDFDSTKDQICHYDLSIDVKDINFKLLDDINILAPFGEGNPKPIFKSNNVEITDAQSIGSDKTHLKGKIQQKKSNVDFIAFGFSQAFSTMSDIPLYDTYYQIGVNEWRGKKTLQLMINDIQSDLLSSKFIDWRNREFDINQLESDVTLVFFNKRYYDLFVRKNNNQAYLWNSPEIKNIKKMLIFDRPHDIEKFKKLVEIQNADVIYIQFYSQLRYSYELVPDKKEMHDALKYFLTHKSILEEDYQMISEYLHININNLKFYINVFFELGFVKIENGVVTPLGIDKSKEVENSVFYQKRLKRNEVGSLLVNATYQDLLAWIEKQ
ncbi:single-stranded-DNA-specific exonuclease [Companilactobacillus sp. RD055328]|uniref:single-stranded-DNA-specific exonuclease RecJ n=1 Tax=Companilactobacillus sp. RD055328 TaxID=2916634 RepID=UPI001FC8810B|nr:single-stranded-DNA-specific exonuclease RecJ [Companilactobacillus sp. RD055328]GKQ42635.1 single-stranded-DNA-specific exonuclease [Companilactobacillus sp. RD055328]